LTYLSAIGRAAPSLLFYRGQRVCQIYTCPRIWQTSGLLSLRRCSVLKGRFPFWYWAAQIRGLETTLYTPPAFQLIRVRPDGQAQEL
jgi:hypothetical protein